MTDFIIHSILKLKEAIDIEPRDLCVQRGPNMSYKYYTAFYTMDNRILIQ